MTHLSTAAQGPALGHSEAPSAVQGAALQSGAILDGKYRLETQVAEGGMGVVWLATHLDLERPVAIKFIRDELAHSPEAVTRMLLEARAVAQLRGEHVVRIIDIARLASGAPYIVMEYLEGNDLFSELAHRGAFQVSAAVDLILQACEGLAEAHAAGLVHRDLKPENLFLAVQPDSSVVLKLVDFGVTKEMDRATLRGRCLTQATTFLGSPYYTSPEQIQHAADVDVRTDVWSLGAILYELIAGVCPFEAATPQEVCLMVIYEEPAPLATFRADLPDGIEAVIRRCLAKDRAQRYATVAELAEALAPFGSESALERASRVSRVVAVTTYNAGALDSVPPPLALPRHAELKQASTPLALDRTMPLLPIPSAEPVWEPAAQKRGTPWFRAALLMMITAATAFLLLGPHQGIADWFAPHNVEPSENPQEPAPPPRAEPSRGSDPAADDLSEREATVKSPERAPLAKRQLVAPQP